MGRPPKPPGEVKKHHVRVPVTDAQRALIEQAARLAEEGVAGWARRLLLDAARKQVEKARKAGDDPA